MKTSEWDVLQVARNFAGKVRLEVDMGKAVGIPLRTAVVMARLADEWLATLERRTSELRRELRLGITPNRRNAEEELKKNLGLIYMLENNCIPTLHEIVDAEFHSKNSKK